MKRELDPAARDKIVRLRPYAGRAYFFYSSTLGRFPEAPNGWQVEPFVHPDDNVPDGTYQVRYQDSVQGGTALGSQMSGSPFTVTIKNSSASLDNSQTDRALYPDPRTVLLEDEQHRRNLVDYHKYQMLHDIEASRQSLVRGERANTELGQQFLLNQAYRQELAQAAKQVGAAHMEIADASLAIARRAKELVGMNPQDNTATYVNAFTQILSAVVGGRFRGDGPVDAVYEGESDEAKQLKEVLAEAAKLKKELEQARANGQQQKELQLRNREREREQRGQERRPQGSAESSKPGDAERAVDPGRAESSNRSDAQPSTELELADRQLVEQKLREQAERAAERERAERALREELQRATERERAERDQAERALREEIQRATERERTERERVERALREEAERAAERERVERGLREEAERAAKHERAERERAERERAEHALQVVAERTRTEQAQKEPAQRDSASPRRPKRGERKTAEQSQRAVPEGESQQETEHGGPEAPSKPEQHQKRKRPSPNRAQPQEQPEVETKPAKRKSQSKRKRSEVIAQADLPSLSSARKIAADATEPDQGQAQQEKPDKRSPWAADDDVKAGGAHTPRQEHRGKSGKNSPRDGAKNSGSGKKS